MNKPELVFKDFSSVGRTRINGVEYFEGPEAKDIKNPVKVYLASPWFTPECADRRDRVLSGLIAAGYLVHSPQHMGGVGDISQYARRKEIFDINCNGIKESDLTVAITNSKDPGTLWEIGAAYAWNKRSIGFFEVSDPSVKFNIMLELSFIHVCTKFEDLVKYLSTYSSRSSNSGHTWTGGNQ